MNRMFVITDSFRVSNIQNTGQSDTMLTKYQFQNMQFNTAWYMFIL